MSKRFFVDDAVTNNGKYRVLQEDSETKERFGVKDFDTREEARRTADDMQKAVENALSEQIALEEHKNRFKDTLQDLKDETSQD